MNRTIYALVFLILSFIHDDSLCNTLSTWAIIFRVILHKSHLFYSLQRRRHHRRHRFIFFLLLSHSNTNWAGERELLFGHFIHTLMCPEMVRGDKLSFNSVSFSALQTSWFVVLRQQSEDVIRERVDNALRRPREEENEESRRWWGSRTLRCKFSWSTTTSSIATTRQKHSRMPTERESLSILCGANANILYDQKKKSDMERA